VLVVCDQLLQLPLAEFTHAVTLVKLVVTANLPIVAIFQPLPNSATHMAFIPATPPASPVVVAMVVATAYELPVA
jgi:hypothetical protein